jgi:hypothetical protein
MFPSYCGLLRRRPRLRRDEDIPKIKPVSSQAPEGTKALATADEELAAATVAPADESSTAEATALLEGSTSQADPGYNTQVLKESGATVTGACLTESVMTPPRTTPLTSAATEPANETGTKDPGVHFNIFSSFF